MVLKKFFLFFLIGMLPFYLLAVTLTDEEIVENFTVKNKTVQHPSGKSLTLSLHPDKISQQFLPSDSTSMALPVLNSIQCLEVTSKFNFPIPSRDWFIFISLFDEGKKRFLNVGYLKLEEIFYQTNSNNETKSALLILHRIHIDEWKQNQGIGRAALSFFLESLDALDSSRINHNLYAILGNSNPGVYKMYLEKGFNYFVNAESNYILKSRYPGKYHDAALLERIKNEPSSSFSSADVPSGCLIKREPGGKRLYDPHFF